MVVLLTGASGFIGSRVAAALAGAGHTVICVQRAPPPSARPGRLRYLRADFTTDADPAAWVPRLVGVDVVINAAGILRERGAQTFAAVHERAPAALFRACVLAGVEHVIQVSALGADRDAVSAYHTSKRAADEALARLPLKWVVVQPSLVYGDGGRSAAMFAGLAAAPLVPLPGRGEQRIQPVHVADVVDGIVALVARRDLRQAVLPFVGPEPLTLRDFLTRLRAALGLGAAHFVSVPLALVRIAARAGDWTTRGLLDADTFDMLVRGNAGDPAPLERLLERRARRVEEFIDTGQRDAARRAALLEWLLPLTRYAIAIVWIVSGTVSLGLYPTTASLRLLERVGVANETLAYLFLYGAALLDIGLGVATIVLARRRLLWLAQIAVVLTYTAIISARLPELWLEPFGPLLKNVPMLAALWWLYELDGRRWNT